MGIRFYKCPFFSQTIMKTETEDFTVLGTKDILGQIKDAFPDIEAIHKQTFSHYNHCKKSMNIRNAYFSICLYELTEYEDMCAKILKTITDNFISMDDDDQCWCASKAKFCKRICLSLT